MEDITHLEQYRSFHAAIEGLAKSIVTQRMQSIQIDSSAYLAQAAPHFASLHAVNRKSSTYAVEAKSTTSQARKSIDQAHLSLQNLLFQRNHLEKEITNCQRFESVILHLYSDSQLANPLGNDSSEYLDLPIHSLQELDLLLASATPPKALLSPLPTDPHQLMLARLEFDLAERQR